MKVKRLYESNVQEGFNKKTYLLPNSHNTCGSNHNNTLLSRFICNAALVF